MADERWKPIKGCPGYEISNHGRVRSPKTILKPWDDGRGYLRVKVGGVKFKVHKLVGEHFKRNPNKFELINHKDGDKHNNQASNLEWTTQSENVRHAWKHGLIKRKVV